MKIGRIVARFCNETITEGQDLRQPSSSLEITLPDVQHAASRATPDNTPQNTSKVRDTVELCQPFRGSPLSSPASME